MNREKENNSNYNIQKSMQFNRASNWSSTTTSSNSMLISSTAKSNSTSNLPPLKETNKFSSWTDKSLFDQVDEILFDQEATMPEKPKKV